MTRPVGVLDISGAPEGVCCVEPETKSFRNVDYCQITGQPGRVTTGPGPHFRALTWLHVGPTWPSCRSCLSILSIWAPTWLQLGPSLLQLGPTKRQLGPTWSHLGRTWLQLGPILVPTWSNMVRRSDQDELQEVFSGDSKRCQALYRFWTSCWFCFFYISEGVNNPKL